MSDQNKSKIAEQLFVAGSDAVRKGNFDYAIDLFQKCARLTPGKLLYRQALRGAEYKKYDNNKKGASMAALRMKPAQLKLKTAKARKKWPEVIDAAEDVLELNPWDVSSLHDLASACKELGYVETGIWVLETAVAVDKESATLFRLLGDLCEQAELYDKALVAYGMVRKLNPADQEASARERQLQAQATMKRGKYEEAGSFRDTLNPAAQAVDSELSAAADPQNRTRREIAELEGRLAQDASNANLLVQIGDKYRSIRECEKAVAMFLRAFEATGQRDFDIKAKMLDCQIDPLRVKLLEIEDQMRALDKRAPDAAELTKQLHEQHKKVEAAIVKREIDYFALKTEVNHDDAESFYELGYRRLRVNQVDDAIACLQKGRHDARHKWEALLWLGYAFWQKKNFALADKNLAESAAAVPTTDESARKQVLYFRGRVAQDRGNKDEALHFFNEIAAIDYGYKDVSKRLDLLNAEPAGSG